MRTGKEVIFIILICACYFSTSFSSIIVLAQSSSSASQLEASLPAYIKDGPIPGGYIMGYILDEDGNPVPGATVSLLQEGQLWTPEKYNYPYSGNNPQRTRIAYYNTEGSLTEGSFLFGLPLPDDYTLDAEKDGYKGSANVHVPHELLDPSAGGSISRTFTVNITLKGYHQPAFSPEQLSYTGAIVGEIPRANGYHTIIFNVSLLQDGRLVKMPNNPQPAWQRTYSGKNVDYIFEHLAPGRYTVMVEYNTFPTIMPPMYNDTVTVEVGTGTVIRDIALSQEPHWQSAASILSGLLTFLTIAAVAYYMIRWKNKG